MRSKTIKLSPRQSEVMDRVAQGQNSRQIAEDLVVSKRTIDFHRESILRKFDVENMILAINKARELGILGER